MCEFVLFYGDGGGNCHHRWRQSYVPRSGLKLNCVGECNQEPCPHQLSYRIITGTAMHAYFVSKFLIVFYCLY